MQTFRDQQNRTWQIEVNVFTAGRLKRETGFDAMALMVPGSDGLRALCDDPVLLFDVLTSLLGDQLQRANVTPEDFGRALTEQEIQDAVKALVEAVINFSHPSKAKLQMEAFRRVWNETEAHQQNLIQQAETTLNSDEFGQHVKQSIQTAYGNTSGS